MPVAASSRAATNVGRADITHEDNPNENIWFKTPALAAREKGCPPVHAPERVPGRPGVG